MKKYRVVITYCVAQTIEAEDRTEALDKMADYVTSAHLEELAGFESVKVNEVKEEEEQ
jgi:hypothetical protein